MPRPDVPVKVKGSTHYAIDTRLDGMAYAAVIEFPAAPGKGGPNHLRDGVAVVADSYYRAMRALSLVRSDWDIGAHAGISNETQAQEAATLLETPGEVAMEQEGDAPALIAASTRVVTADYHRPYETHARMEPINATVSVTDTRVDVWSPTHAAPATSMCTRSSSAAPSVRTVGQHGGHAPGRGAVGASAPAREGHLVP